MNKYVNRHLPWFILGSVLLGVLFPDTFSPLNNLSVPMFTFMTFVSSLGGGFRDLAQVARRPLPVVTVLFLMHVVMPLLALGTGNILFPDSPLFTLGLVLECCIPTGIASLIWASVAGGSVPLCLSIVLLDTLISPAIIPLTLNLLADSSVKMDTLGMMGDLMIMVAIPALLAMTLYHFTKGSVAQTVKPRLEPFSKITLLLIITGNATSCAPFLKNIDRTLILVMAATIGLCLTGFFFGYCGGRLLRLDYPSTQTMCLNTGMRNISAGAVLAIQYFPAEVLFPVAFSPIFLQLMTAFIIKLLHRTRAGQLWQKEHAT